jgi:hypothetical protein
VLEERFEQAQRDLVARQQQASDLGGRFNVLKALTQLHFGCAGRPARGRWCKSITMKE